MSGQFLVKVVAVPVVVRRQVLGSPWCASATDHGGFRRAADHGGNHGGDSAGDKVVDMLVIVQRQVLGETEQKTEEVPQFRSHADPHGCVAEIRRLIRTVTWPRSVVGAARLLGRDQVLALHGCLAEIPRWHVPGCLNVCAF